MARFDYLDSTGVVVPDTSETRANAEAFMRGLLGADVPLNPETPQGVFVTAMTMLDDGTAKSAADVVNLLNPDNAYGIILDSVMRWTGGERRPATQSELIGVEMRGVPNTIIPAGSLATVAATKQQFYLVNNAQIDANGLAVGNFKSVEYGPIQVGAHGLVEVSSNVLGWETVDNPTAAIAGRDEESDPSARITRMETRGAMTMSIPEAVITRVLRVDGVRSMKFLENITSSTATIQGVLLEAHSTWICVDGGDNLEIAMAYAAGKTGGANYSGDISVPVVDPWSGQSTTVKITRPAEEIVMVKATIHPTPLDATTIVQQAIAAYQRGDIGGERGYTVGKSVSPWELAAIINMYEPLLTIRKVELSADGGGTWTTDEITCDANQILRTPASAISVDQV